MTAIIGIVSGLAAIISACYGVYNIIDTKLRNKENDEIKIESLKSELIDEFIIPYYRVKSGLKLIIIDNRNNNESVGNMLNILRNGMPEFNTKFLYWQSNKVEIIQLMKKKQGEEEAGRIIKFISNVEDFANLYGFLISQMEAEKDTAFNIFCENFLKKHLSELRLATSLFQDLRVSNDICNYIYASIINIDTQIEQINKILHIEVHDSY